MSLSGSWIVWLRSTCSSSVWNFLRQNQGLYSSYGGLVIMPASSVTRYPEKLSEIEAASYLMAYLTGCFALHTLTKRVLADTNGEGAEVIYDAVAGKQLTTLGKIVVTM